MKKIWSDPVWSKVIATAIVTIFGVGATYIWPSVRLLLESSTQVPNWLLAAMLPGAAAIYFIAHATDKMQRRQSSNTDPRVPWNPAPHIEIHHQQNAPYEVSAIQHHHVLSTVRIGITNSGSRPLSNCKVYVEKIAPEPALPGGLPILLDGAGFTLRHDDPEKFVDVAAHWDHVDKFRFSAPIGGGFAETLSYIKSRQPLTIMIKVVAVECQRCASFRIWTDDAKAMHLQFISYVS